MTISIDFPPGLEAILRESVKDLPQAIKETFLVDLVRQDKLTEFELGRALGISRFEVDALLKKHGVYYDITAEEVIRESEGLRKLREDNARRS